MPSAEDYIREAESVERLAQFISLWPHRQMLMEEADALRRRAAQMGDPARPSSGVRPMDDPAVQRETGAA